MKLDMDVLDLLTRYYDGSYWFFPHILEMVLDISDKSDFDPETVCMMSIATELSCVESYLEDTISKLIDLYKPDRPV